MKIALGQTVWTSDREKIGVVDRVLINAVGKHVEHIVVHRGILIDHDRLISRSAIDHVDDNGIVLNINSETASALPGFDHSFASPDLNSGYPEAIPGPYQSMILFSTPPPGQTYLDRGHLFRLDPLDGPLGSSDSEMPEGEIVIGKGAEVFDSNGRRIGQVHKLEYDSAGELSAVVVKTGVVRHHDLRIDASLIASIVDEEIVLSVTGEEATKRSS